MPEQEPATPSPDDVFSQQPRRSLKLTLNVLIAVMLIVVGYFSYTFIARSSVVPEKDKTPPQSQKVIQLDVLNGCGVKGIAVKFTNYLRTKGFDVVEMKNYKTFNIQHTVVVDRVGDLASARRIALTLGVAEKNIVQQINPDYFVDVSVIIGEDYSSLRGSHNDKENH